MHRDKRVGEPNGKAAVAEDSDARVATIQKLEQLLQDLEKVSKLFLQELDQIEKLVTTFPQAPEDSSPELIHELKRRLQSVEQKRMYLQMGPSPTLAAINQLERLIQLKQDQPKLLVLIWAQRILPEDYLAELGAKYQRIVVCYQHTHTKVK